jgi:hypothetical protein
MRTGHRETLLLEVLLLLLLHDDASRCSGSWGILLGRYV